MKKVSIKKLIKEKKVQVSAVKPDTKYLLVFDVNFIRYKDIMNVVEAPLLKGCLAIGVEGEPDKAMSIYEVKK